MENKKLKDGFSKLKLDHVNGIYQLNDNDITIADYSIKAHFTGKSPLYMATLTFIVEDLEIINNPPDEEVEFRFEKKTNQ